MRLNTGKLAAYPTSLRFPRTQAPPPGVLSRPGKVLPECKQLGSPSNRRSDALKKTGSLSYPTCRVRQAAESPLFRKQRHWPS